MPHVVQAVAPLVAMYSPPAHGKHDGWPVVALIVPGEHGAGAVEPAAHAEPAGQSVQSVCSSLSVAFEKRPPGQISGASAPTLQYEPATHCLHEV